MDNHNKKSDSNAIFSDTIMKDIPEWLREDTFLQKSWENNNKVLNLQSIQNGYDNLQIRIWIECSDTQSLIILKKEKEWNATFYYYKIQWDENVGQEGMRGSTFNIKDVRITHQEPKSGWKVFSEALIKTKIMDLPDFTSFNTEYNLPTDSHGVTVEIGMPKKYKFYRYPALELNKTLVEGPAKLYEALLLLEKEFSYERPCQYYY